MYIIDNFMFKKYENGITWKNSGKGPIFLDLHIVLFGGPDLSKPRPVSIIHLYK